MNLPITDVKTLERLFIEPHKYVLVVTPASTTITTVEAYAYGPNVVSEVYEYAGRRYFAVVLTEHWAQGTVDRLASGLFAASIHDDWDSLYRKVMEWTS